MRRHAGSIDVAEYDYRVVADSLRLRDVFVGDIDDFSDAARDVRSRALRASELRPFFLNANRHVPKNP